MQADLKLHFPKISWNPFQTTCYIWLINSLNKKTENDTYFHFDIFRCAFTVSLRGTATKLNKNDIDVHTVYLYALSNLQLI